MIRCEFFVFLYVRETVTINCYGDGKLFVFHKFRMFFY
jgi:hypothetical protein